jgi:hypothetical protein
LLVHRRALSCGNADGGERGLFVPQLPARVGVVACDGACAVRSVARHCIRAGLLAAGLAAFGTAAAGAQTKEISILGQWEIVEAVPAPWADEKNHAALAAQGKQMLKLTITFEPKAVKSKNRAFECKRSVIYQPNEIVSDALFQGNLPEPNPAAAAARLGFPKGDVPGVDVRCLKALYTFHFRDPNTAMFNLNRVIYTLKRR